MKRTIALALCVTMGASLSACTVDRNPRPVMLSVETTSKSVLAGNTEQSYSDILSHPAEMYIRDLVSRGVMSGTPDGLMHPDYLLTRAEAATMIARNFKEYTKVSETDRTNYIDVKENSWYKDSIDWVSQAKLMKGTSGIGEKDVFSPDYSITKEQLAVVLYNWFSNNTYDRLIEDLGGLSGEAKDIQSSSEWAIEAVEFCNRANILAVDENNNFNPKAEATRADFATMICKANYIVDDYIAHTW